MLNLTPHEIVVVVSGREHTFPASGTVARVATTDEVVGHCPITHAPIIQRVTGQVDGLPTWDVPVIVSAMVLAACPGRPNTFAPDTGPTAIRNEKGHIVSVTRLVAA